MRHYASASTAGEGSLNRVARFLGGLAGAAGFAARGADKPFASAAFAGSRGLGCREGFACSCDWVATDPPDVPTSG